MNRMGHPFDWSARKRRGSGHNAADAYDQYFHDDVDFPHFGSTWDAFNRAGNKRSQHPTADVNDRSGFFDYLPPEFRQYIPDNFGFGGAGMRHAQQPFGAQTTTAPPPPPPQHPHPHQQQQPQQQQSSANSSRSNLCDAAIQTEDPSNAAAGNERGGNKQNEVPPTGPPHNSSASASSSSSSTPYGNQMHTSTFADGPNAYASASASNPQGHQYSQSPNQQYYQQNPGRQYQQQPYAPPPQGQYFQRQSNVAPATPASAAPPHPPTAANQTQGENFVRNVPIFIEGSTASANNKQTKPRPDPIVCKEVPVQQEHHQQQQQVPSNQTQETNTGDNIGTGDEAVPPQTPHTADCIMKIQAIQRDVLDLMCAVEQFGGKRGDKEYGYLDEMLTRNLLKLDTIDTNGKDSIRMARKEAIKCIQASIAVLEAKADLNLNENQGNANATEPTEGTEKPSESCEEAMELSKTEVIALPPPAPEKMDTNETSPESDQPKPFDDAIAAEIPKVQENVENISIDDKTIAAPPEPASGASATGNDGVPTKTDENTSAK